MPDDITVVSPSTETTEAAAPESSTTDTQTTETPVVETPVAPVTPTDWRAKQREDATLNAHIQSEIARVRARDDRRSLRATAKTAVESENVNDALEVARRVASEVDEDEAHDTAWRTAANKVQPHLERLLKLDSSGQATDPHYVALHALVGKAEMDRRYDENPAAFVDWAEDKILDMRVEARMKKALPALAKGIASDAENAALRGVSTPLTGTAGAGRLTSEQYNSDPALRKKLQSTPEGRKQIDAMMARG